MTKNRDLVKIMDFCHRAIQQATSLDDQLNDNQLLSPTIPLIPREYPFENVQLSSIQQNQNQATYHAGWESFDWVLCYSDDIYKYWRRIENKRLLVKVYPNMTVVRPVLINILRDLRKSYELSLTTLHLAIYILDSFMSRTSEEMELELLVITAMIIAAKVEDIDVKIPRFEELNRQMLDSAYSLIDYRKIETKILFCLDFALNVPTVATFQGFFSRISLVLEEFHIHQNYFYERNPQSVEGNQTDTNEATFYVPFGSYDEMLAAVNQLQERLMDCILNVSGTQFLNVSPSQKAAACVAAARAMYDVRPVWTPFLEMQCSFTENEIRPLMDFIISIYDINLSTSSSNTSPARCSTSTDSDDNTDSNNLEADNSADR